MSMSDRYQLSRRSFLGLGAAAVAGALVPSTAFGAPAARTTLAPERDLSFFHTHTGERLTTAYCSGGEYVAPALNDVNVLLRDFRVNQIKPIDPALLDLLFELNGVLGTDQPFHVISGYRTPQTNAMLPYAAPNSLHMRGMAADIVVRGMSQADVCSHAMVLSQHLGFMGIGWYGSFTHIDIGPKASWSRML